MKRHAFVQLLLARAREFYREPITIFWVYGFPLILALILGIAFLSRPVESPIVDVQGEQGDHEAGAIAAALQDAHMTVAVVSPAASLARFKAGKTDLIIVPRSKELEFVFDPARDKSVLARYWVDDVLTRARFGQLAVRDVSLSEAGSRYIDFLFPGVIGLNIMGGGLFGVGFVLVDMRVRKLFKRLMATPMHRGDFLFALLTARLLFLLPEMATLLLVGWLAFGVPIHGSLGTLLLVILLGAFAFAGLGLLVGCRTDKTETVSGLINLLMLPMYLLSGVFFSSSRFPEAIQPLIQALPLTQLNESLRAVMLEGSGVGDIGGRLAILATWAAIPFILGLRWFRWG